MPSVEPIARGYVPCPPVVTLSGTMPLADLAERGEHVDVVLLDPMFTDPRASDHGFALARDHTVGTPLTPEWVALARAVARRWVVVTAERRRPWFPDAGLVRLEGTRSGRWFRAEPCPQDTVSAGKSV